MPRVKRGVPTRRRKNRIFKLAKGYRGARSKLYRTARETVEKSLNYAFRDRKAKKRDYRKLWIARVNAAARTCGMSYSKLMNGLKKSNININRKMLAELAVSDLKAFEKLAQISKESLGVK